MGSFEDLPFPNEPSLSPPGTTDINPAFPWLEMAGTVLVFLAIFLVALWVIRRLYLSNLRSMETPWARVLDRQLLGGQQNLYLVEIAGQLQILGGSDHHLLKICEINDPVIAAEILEEIAARPTERIDGLLNGLKKLWPWRKKKKESFSYELERLLDEVKK